MKILLYFLCLGYLVPITYIYILKKEQDSTKDLYLAWKDLAESSLSNQFKAINTVHEKVNKVLDKLKMF